MKKTLPIIGCAVWLLLGCEQSKSHPPTSLSPSTFNPTSDKPENTGSAIDTSPPTQKSPQRTARTEKTDTDARRNSRRMPSDGDRHPSHSFDTDDALVVVGGDNRRREMTSWGVGVKALPTPQEKGSAQNGPPQGRTISRAQVQNVLRLANKQAAQCAESPVDEYKIRMRIEKNGTVSAASPVDASTENTELKCLVRIIRQLQFPAATRHLVITYPFSL